MILGHVDWWVRRGEPGAGAAGQRVYRQLNGKRKEVAGEGVGVIVWLQEIWLEMPKFDGNQQLKFCEQVNCKWSSGQRAASLQTQ